MRSQVDISNFEVVRKVGEGGFGKVFQVKDKSTGLTYAAKVSISSIDELAAEEEKFGYLLREINIISKLDHPSILKYVGYSIDDFKSKKRPCIITEFLSNGTLKDIIKLERRGLCKHEWDDTRKLINIYGIAAAMSFLHSHEILHRDLKPENILMDEYLLPKISDFGLSKIKHYNPESDTLKSTTGFKGTMCYSAPEIWYNSEYSKASDVFSFSLILYEIVTNNEPYSGCNEFEILNRIYKQKRPELDKIPSSYRELIEICWDENPANRPSFDEIVKKLKKDPGFITDLVEEVDFEDYTDYIDNCQKTFDFNRSMVKMDKFKLSGKFKKIIKNEVFVEMKKQEVEEEEEKNEICNDNDLPFEFPPNENNDPLIEKSRNLLRKKLNESSIKSIPRIVYHYANLMKVGNVFPVNLKESALFYKISADLGYSKAMTQYGIQLIKGVAVDADFHQAIKYFKSAIEKGDHDAINLYADLLNEGKIIKQNYEKALTYYKMAAEKGNIPALYNIGMMYFEGKGVKINYKKALHYFEKAAENGNNNSYDVLAMMYLNGKGVDVDFKKGFKYEKKSADLGNVDAMYNIGVMYDNGTGVDVNYEKALEYYNCAANKDHAIAINNIGAMYLNGKGVDVDQKEAFNCFQKAASKGCFESMRNLGNLYRQGIGCNLSIKKAFEWFKKAVDAGDKESILCVNLLLDSDKSSKKLKDEMIEYLHQNAKLDNEFAMYCYGYLLLTGELVPQDIKKSCFYFKKSADRGVVSSMVVYANLMKNGVKGEPNLELAFEYYKMAAENENPEAIYNLGILYKKLYSNAKKSQYYLKKAEDLGYQEDKNEEELNYQEDKNEEDIDHRKPKNEEDVDHRKEKNEKDVDNRKPKKESKDDKDQQTKKKELKIEEIKSMKDFLSFIQMAQKGLISTEDLERSFLFFKNSADSGNVDSMVFVGVMYEGGLGTTTDYEEALYYYNRAAKYDNAVALNNIGSMHLAGEGMPVNYKNAIKYFRMSADGGYSVAFRNLGIMYQTGKGVEINFERAVKYYKKAFELGENVCIEFIGSILHSGQLRKELEAELIEFIHNKADSGDSSAMYLYGTLFAIGQIVPKDQEKACHYIKLSVDNNNPKAAILYGNILRNEKKNPKEAFKYYKKAYESGIADGMIKIGELLVLKEIKIDNDDIDFIKKSAFYGEIEALKVFSYLVLNDKRLLNKLKSEADEGNIAAMRTFGYCVKDNDKKISKRYLKYAANNGDKRAKIFFDELK